MSDVYPYVFAKRDSEVKNEKLKTGDTCWIIKDYTILGDEQFYFEWHLIEDVHNLRKMSKVDPDKAIETERMISLMITLWNWKLSPDDLTRSRFKFGSWGDEVKLEKKRSVYSYITLQVRNVDLPILERYYIPKRYSAILDELDFNEEDIRKLNREAAKKARSDRKKLHKKARDKKTQERLEERSKRNARRKKNQYMQEVKSMKKIVESFLEDNPISSTASGYTHD